MCLKTTSSDVQIIREKKQRASSCSDERDFHLTSYIEIRFHDYCACVNYSVCELSICTFLFNLIASEIWVFTVLQTCFYQPILWHPSNSNIIVFILLIYSVGENVWETDHNIQYVTETVKCWSVIVCVSVKFWWSTCDEFGVQFAMEHWSVRALCVCVL